MAEFDEFRQSRDVQAPTSGNSEGQQPTERAMRNSAEKQPEINKWEEFTRTGLVTSSSADR
jgi:hypothetical protein